jgi:hypothetical protein
MAIDLALSSLQTGELYKALTKAQVNFFICTKDADNPFYKSKYALYEDLLRASRSALAEQGLCAISKILFVEGDVYSVLELHHGASEQFTRAWQKLEPTKKDMQGFSGAHSYWRRVMYRDLIGIICSDEDDDDGNIACNVVSTNNQGVINNDMLAQLQALLDDQLTAKICDHYKINNLAQLKQSEFAVIMQRFKK